MMMMPTVSFSRLKAMPITPLANWTSSCDLDIGQAGGTGNPIAGFQHRANVGDAHLRLEGFDLLLQIAR